VKVKNLHKIYGNGYPAVGGVSFGMKNNEVMGLLGPNGAGKSTTFSVLTMEHNRSYGDIRMREVNLENFDC
jgi:ABC-2 type transport system ATP-binding protein